MIEVVVEAWLTGDEYKLAKERFELAWQDPPTVDVEMETPSEPQTPVKGGDRFFGHQQLRTPTALSPNGDPSGIPSPTTSPSLLRLRFAFLAKVGSAP